MIARLPTDVQLLECLIYIRGPENIFWCSGATELTRHDTYQLLKKMRADGHIKIARGRWWPWKVFFGWSYFEITPKGLQYFLTARLLERNRET